MSLEESNKISKEIPSQDSLNDLVESGNDYSPDVTDMLWTAAKKEALRNDKDSDKSR